MKKIIKTIYLLLFICLVFACNKAIEKEEYRGDSNIDFLQPQINKIDTATLQTIKLTPKFVVAKKADKVKYTGTKNNRAAPPDTRTVSEPLTIHTPGTNNIIKPKVYIIPDSGYSIQHNDTIGAAKVTTVIQPEPTQAANMKYKDNATNDIQYLDLEQGMYSSYIFSMVQDQRGNFWFGTWGVGLSKYDGTEFIHFTEKEGIPNNYIYSMTEDRNGNLWLGSERGGVCFYNGKTFTTYTGVSALKDYLVKAIIEDSKGNIWFGSEGGGVIKYNGTQFTVFNQKNGLSNNIVKSLLEDAEGNIWIGTDGGGLNKFDGNSFTHYNTSNGLCDSHVWSLVQDKNSNLWIGTNKGVCRFDGIRFQTYSKKQGISDNIILNMLIDNEGDLWLGTQYGGVSKLMISSNDTAFSIANYTQNEGLSNNNVWSMTEDISGNIWVGTYGGGVNKLNLASLKGEITSFTNITQKQGLSSNLVPAVIQAHDSTYWIGMDGGGIDHFDGEYFYRYNTNHGLINNSVLAVIEDRQNNLWIGTKEGVCRFDGDKFMWISENEGLPQNYINALYEDYKGNIWIGTNGGGICKLTINSNHTELIVYKTNNGLGNNFIRTIIEDSKNNLWIGTENGVSKFEINGTKHGDCFVNYTVEDGLRHNFVWSMTEDSKGNIWLGTGNDVSKLVNIGIKGNDSTFFIHYTDKDGLNTNHVWSVIEDHQRNVWLGTDYGLGRLSPVGTKTLHVNDNYTYSEPEYSYSTYITDDGLKGLDFWYNSVCIDTENQIWWGTSKGLSVLKLNNLRDYEKPPVIHLKSIDIAQTFIDFRKLSSNKNNKKVLTTGETAIQLNRIKYSKVEPFYNYPLDLSLPHHLHHITFNFVGIDWSAYHKIRYKYMLEGLDKEWSVLTNETKAEYRNIPHGSYTFKVKAIGIAKQWSRSFDYSFTVRPPWWLTWWAKSLWILLIVSNLYIFYQIRVSSLKRQAQILELKVQERTAQLNEANEELSAINDALNNTLETVKKQKEEIEYQKDKIQAAHQDIRDSITYAKRIQKAVLPPPTFLSEVFPEHFVLFKPKEIVSGDFYYAEMVGDYVVVVAADCTGHGVPGAFMSMLGTAFLNEIVHKKSKLTAAAILEELRKKVKTSLHQTGKMKEARDGMDIALCLVNTKTRLMHFSGAYNPLYLIRNGELKYIKSDRQPIAIYIKERDFTNHTIELQKDDVFYIFSDGYADQMGGPDDKKFMAKRFMRLLNEIHKKPLEEQKEILDKTIEDWRGDKEQIDDILVMGVRV